MALLDSPWKNALLGLASLKDPSLLNSVVDQKRKEEERKRQQEAQNRFFGLLSTQDAPQQAGLLNYGQGPEERKRELSIAAMKAGYPQFGMDLMKPQGGSKYGLSPTYGINPQTGKGDYFITNERGQIQWMNTGGKGSESSNYQIVPGADGYFAVNTRNPADVQPVVSQKTSQSGTPSQVKPMPRNSEKGVLPLQALKEQNKILEDVESVLPINSQLKDFQEKIEKGELDLGLIRNIESGARNYLGISDKTSRNYGSFKAMLEKMRNASLRLNAGVQTEGDAVRAWNELLNNINDEKFVVDRLKEIQALNDEAVKLRESRVNMIRQNYNQPPIDIRNTLQGGQGAGMPEYEIVNGQLKRVR